MRKEKVRETDYQKSERPETRLEQFFDIGKHRFVELLKLSLLQTVFNVPLIVTIILFYALIRNSNNINALMMVFVIQGLSLLITLPISFMGMSGSYYSIKKMAFMEGEFASSSFFIGLREEWKRGALIGLLSGLSTCISVIGFFFLYFYMSSINSTISAFGIAILFIQSIVVLMVCYYSMGQITIYENPLRFVLKNSFIMTLIKSPINLLMFLLHPGIFIALILIMEITMFVGTGLMVFFVAFGHLIWMMNLLSAFDKYINKVNHPDFYRRGLYIEESKEA